MSIMFRRRYVSATQRNLVAPGKEFAPRDGRRACANGAQSLWSAGMRRRYLPALAAAGAVLMFGANPAFAADYQPGSTTGPDPYFPAAGNGGYDAEHYNLTFRYDTATKVMSQATAT